MMDEWGYTGTFPEPKILVCTRDYERGILFGTVLKPTVDTAWVGWNIAWTNPVQITKYDKIILTFEPSSPKELKWFAELVERVSKPDTSVVYLHD